MFPNDVLDPFNGHLGGVQRTVTLWRKGTLDITTLNPHLTIAAKPAISFDRDRRSIETRVWLFTLTPNASTGSPWSKQASGSKAQAKGPSVVAQPTLQKDPGPKAH